ncbi:hypothetical protein LZ198_13335 [Myxococcus sp. K15C18031901]|uniref:hypothetical protein n=1 Tax=Myxococcus dinghuensis TaxID=2906761 RepID=UPI0020A70083|nr:hypothetical protein [Myxococcus dinghuensis]MCP3099852.1 hypothetical protein [Myxococcus dinghuensis]
MRLALASAALTFSFLLSPMAHAQSAGGSTGGSSTQGTGGTGSSTDTQSGTGGAGSSQSTNPDSTGGTYSVPPEGTTGTQDQTGSGTGSTGTTGGADTTGTGGAGSSNPDMNNPSMGDAGTGGSDINGTGGAGSGGTGGSTQPGSGSSGGSDINGTGGAGSGSTTSPDTSGSSGSGSSGSGSSGSGSSEPNNGSSPNMGSSTQASSGTTANPRDAARATDERAQTRNANALASGKAQDPKALTAEVAQLRSDVQRLQRQVNTLHGDKGANAQGTGGSGATANTSGANPDRTVVASVVMRGQVASSHNGRVVVRDAETGDLYNLRVSQTTQVLHGNQRVAARSLRQGTPVQAAYNLIANGDSYATRLQVTPVAEQPARR